MSTHYSLHVLRIQDVVWKPRLCSKVPDLYVIVKLDDIIKKTQTIKKELSPTWNVIFTLSSSDTSPALNIQVKHKSSLRKDPCISSIDIKLSDLLQKCANGEAQLRLKPSAENASIVPTGVLHLRLEVTNATASVEVELKAAGQAVLQHGIVRSAEATDSIPIAAVDAANQLSGDADLYKSIGDLISKLDVFVKVIDVLTEIHPYLNVAWQVTSALYKAVSKQFEADKKVTNLVRAMEDAFDFVRDTDSLPCKARSLEQPIIRLLKQTTECCLFVQHYTRHGANA